MKEKFFQKYKFSSEHEYFFKIRHFCWKFPNSLRKCNFSSKKQILFIKSAISAAAAATQKKMKFFKTVNFFKTTFFFWWIFFYNSFLFKMVNYFSKMRIFLQKWQLGSRKWILLKNVNGFLKLSTFSQKYVFFSKMWIVLRKSKFSQFFFSKLNFFEKCELQWHAFFSVSFFFKLCSFPQKMSSNDIIYVIPPNTM